MAEVVVVVIAVAVAHIQFNGLWLLLFTLLDTKIGVNIECMHGASPSKAAPPPAPAPAKESTNTTLSHRRQQQKAPHGQFIQAQVFIYPFLCVPHSFYHTFSFDPFRSRLSFVRSFCEASTSMRN